MLTASLVVPADAQIATKTESKSSPIEWQQSTRQLIQAGGLYGRVARVDKKTVACIYERAGGVHLKISADNGKTWSQEIGVAQYEYGNAANPELVILSNGDWLCSFNQRPRNKEGEPAQSFAIAICRSVDKGQTWSAPQVIYRAGTTGSEGCWEPRAIVAKNGDVQMFFANEAPFPDSHEQEISRMISRDGGKTWGKAQRVSFRQHARDGMPVPIILKNGNLVMAIEDNGLSGSFKPVIIDLSDSGDRFVAGESARRWSALRTPLPAQAYAGAPYLCQMPNGLTVLSSQFSLDGNDRMARMAVWVGDHAARNFANLSLPFGEENQASSLWNSVWVKDVNTVNALSSTSVEGVFGLWSIDGIVTN